MFHKPLKSIIASGESVTVEFKRSFDTAAIETISAFANTVGGSVFIGVGDDGKITGVTVGKETLKEWQNNIKTATAGNPEPLFEEIGEGFRVTLFKVVVQKHHSVTPLVTPLVNDDLMRGSLSEKILLLITNDGSISMSEIGKKLGIQRDTVKEYIARLKQDEKIRRVGKTRAGHWEIVKKSTESVGEGAFHNDPV